MKRYIRSSSGYPYPYKQSPEYARLADYGYTLEVNKRPTQRGGRGLDYNEYTNACVIKFPDGDTYASFTFLEPTDPDLLDEFSIEHGMNHWDVYADGERINDRIDYEPYTFDECVVCALRYFWSYY